jgi:hypothetical protein
MIDNRTQIFPKDAGSFSQQQQIRSAERKKEKNSLPNRNSPFSLHRDVFVRCRGFDLQLHWNSFAGRTMSTPQASLLSQITGITFAGEDDPRLQTTAKDLCDDFRLDALRLEAAAESRLLEEVGKCILSLAQQK